MEDWYSNIHIRDALRFRLAGEQPCRPEGFDWQYLALYDVFDPVRFSREHLDNALTSRMQVSGAIDDSLLYDFHYYPLLFQDNDPDVGHSGGVILEELNPRTTTISDDFMRKTIFVKRPLDPASNRLLS